jgi:hypothetical protein
MNPRPLLLTLSASPQPPWARAGVWVCLGHLLCESSPGTLGCDTTKLMLGPSRSGDASAGVVRPPPYAFRRQGPRLWEVTYQSQTRTIPHYTGLIYLTGLLGNPGRTFPAVELANFTGGWAASVSSSDQAELSLGSGNSESALLDQRARKEIQERLNVLTSKKNTRGLSTDEEAERRLLQEELRKTTGLAGNPRTFPSPSTKMANNISLALKRAIKGIGDVHPVLAMYLRNSIETGRAFTYRPHEPITWHIEFEHDN